MAKKRMAKSEPLGKVVMKGQEDALKELVWQVVHEVMAEEAAGAVGAGPYERYEERHITHRSCQPKYTLDGTQATGPTRPPQLSD